jgi:periplasmic divalent cation tolerance protein
LYTNLGKTPAEKQLMPTPDSTLPSSGPRWARRAVLVLTTWPADRDPAPLARALVEERLAACVNVLPEMRSYYRWEGAVQEDAERQLLLKTTADRVDALRERLHALHPYDVPEFLVLPIGDGSTGYLAWLFESVASRDARGGGDPP